MKVTLDRTTAKRQMEQYRSRGVTLIELLVAITIGAVLIFGATQVYVDSRNTYEITEASARLQETARYALSVIEPDVRMSNNWGLVKGAGVIDGQAAQTVTSAGAPTNCGTNFARDLILNLEGDNNSYGFPSTCGAYGAAAAASSDTLTVRRAAATVVAPGATSPARLQICSTRVMGQLVTDSAACTAAPAGQVNDLVVHSYYISQDSLQSPGLPSLRRKTLIGGPAFRDDEIIPGIEDLQVQFGIDTTGTSGVATRYVNPDEVNVGGVPDGSQIVSVRIWLLVRAENPEVGFSDGRTYSYGDRSAYAPADGFRRLLVSRTIQIRNALGT